MTPYDGTHAGPRLLLVGCGNMGSALLSCWVAQLKGWQLSVISPTPIPKDLENNVSLYAAAADVGSAIDPFDIVVLAVKPDLISVVLPEIASFYNDHTVFISVAAGKTTQTIAALLPENQPVIRVMPNTPARIGRAASVGFAADSTHKSHRTYAEVLFSAAGTFDWVEDESLFDAVTAVSGSGPAYVFYMIEALEKAALSEGLPEDLARTLARQTVIGAAALAESQPGIKASELRGAVTSPGGTTEAGLKILMDGRFDEILEQTIKAAAERGRAL